MIKKNIDFKLVNIAVILGIAYLLYSLNSLIFSIINIFFKVTGPFIIAFVLAYAIEPALNFLIKKKIPKNISITIIIFSFLIAIGLLVALIMPILFEQLTSLFDSIITFVKDLINNNNLELGSIQETLNNVFNSILNSVGGFVSAGVIGSINASLNIFTAIFIIFSATVYFLIDMKNIREKVKKYTSKKSNNFTNYIALLDNQMKLYLTGFSRIIFITITEYTLLYAVIGHPNALLIGVLAGLGNLIPVFGALIVNAIGLITALVIGPSLAIKVGVVILISSILDSYVINPLVYKKTNQVPPILILFSVFAGATLWGFVGVVISIPLTIVIISTYKYYRTSIEKRIEEVRKNK